MGSLHKKITTYFFLILFTGYNSSITLFVHTHIVNSVKIVHSHPYNIFKCAKNKKGEKTPLHHHTKNEYELIHTLSHFLTIVFFFSTGIKAVEKLFAKFILKKVDTVFLHFYFFFANGFRAPPLIVNH